VSTTLLPIASAANIASRLTATAHAMPDELAVVVPQGRDGNGRRIYQRRTFRDLDQDSDVLAAGLHELGVTPGTRLALMVRPGFDFISLVFALFKSGAVQVLIDPGMGRRNLVRCLEEAEPEGFVAIPVVHAVRTFLRGRFPQARFNVTVGQRWFWDGPTLDELRKRSWRETQTANVTADDPAAIIFTSGSTGPPKGVLYPHGTFQAQVDQIRDAYGIQPGEVDLSCFPLFALFNCAMGVTTVIPDMDASRPAKVEPRHILEAVEDLQVTQSFGSPAVWNRVGQYCEEHGLRLPSLKRVFAAGAPVPAHVLRRMKACIHPEGEIHTPYGATEALPVASISASEVLGETQARTEQGGGVCVGRPFPQLDWKVIEIIDGPIAALAEANELPAGQIGELIVCGPVVTRQYINRPHSNALAKISDGPRIWHRMGDVGYLDPQGRFWFCGRMSQRVVTAAGTLFTIPCEAVFNTHPHVWRSALVGIGPPGNQRPAIVVQTWPRQRPRSAAATAKLLAELRELGKRHPHTACIEEFLWHPSLPVDIRHNAKIFREKLALWAARKRRIISAPHPPPDTIPP
jgi:acyl-CoA synthetase (AMP-forming)/AMP-acid ligase II